MHFQSYIFRTSSSCRRWLALVVVGALAATATLVGQTESASAVDNPTVLRGGSPIGGAPTQTFGLLSCSITATGHKGVDGTPQVLTAGECDQRKNGGSFQVLERPTAGSDAVSISDPQGDGGRRVVGGKVTGASLWEPDGAGLLSVAGSSVSTAPEALTWGNGTGAALASTPLVVRDVVAPQKGQKICKSSDITGWKCGTIIDIVSGHAGDSKVSYEQIVTDICSTRGEAGAPGFVGNALVGMAVGASWADTCDPAAQYVAKPYTSFISMKSAAGRPSIMSTIGSIWEPGVKVERPLISTASSGNVITTSLISGTLQHGGTNHTVTLKVGAKTFSAAVGADGTWKITLTGIAAGTHDYKLVASWGKWSVSAESTGKLAVAKTSRIAGSDRWDGGALISKAAYPGTAPVVYVASGENFPDALSAGAAAAKAGGPLLITPTAFLPGSVKAEIQRLKPSKVVVVGGPAAVSADVYNALKPLASSISRISGSDRFETSRAVAASFATSGTAYIAAGANFPDALSAGAPAVAAGSPIVLVDGAAASADAATVNALTKLGVKSTKIVGGVNAVSAGVESSLRSKFTIKRFAGVVREDTSRLVNTDFFSTASSAFIATSANFPDALTGSVLAGKNKAPLYLVPGTCVPADTLTSMASQGVSTVTTIGGTAVVTDAARALARC